MRSSNFRFPANRNVRLGICAVAIMARTPGLDPVIARDREARPGKSPGMSNEQIENRLGPFVDEILRIRLSDSSRRQPGQQGRCAGSGYCRDWMTLMQFFVN